MKVSATLFCLCACAAVVWFTATVFPATTRVSGVETHRQYVELHAGVLALGVDNEKRVEDDNIASAKLQEQEDLQDVLTTESNLDRARVRLVLKQSQESLIRQLPSVHPSLRLTAQHEPKKKRSTKEPEGEKKQKHTHAPWLERVRPYMFWFLVMTSALSIQLWTLKGQSLDQVDSEPWLWGSIVPMPSPSGEDISERARLARRIPVLAIPTLTREQISPPTIRRLQPMPYTPLVVSPLLEDLEACLEEAPTPCASPRLSPVCRTLPLSTNE